jgi:glycerol-3-phosphate acyltransferase PlsX
MKITVAVDAMGGDHGVSVTIPATLAFLSHHSDVHALLVGKAEQIAPLLARAKPELRARISVVEASEVVGMDESPAVALKNKRDSSLRVAINQVKDGKAQACVSAGNTGALMATARFVLKTLPGIDRPAIASSLPSQTGETLVLDLGANVDCTPEHLRQFAIMGVALESALRHDPNPKVALLNIGEEEIKGNEVVKQAAELLRASDLNFVGNVEGNDIYKGTADVVVCDGFVGNVALKTSEGLAKMIGEFLKEAFSRSVLTKMVAALALPILKSFKNKVDPRRYNGATLIGLRGVVVKSHGSADILAFETALNKAYIEVKEDVLDKITSRVAKLHAMEARKSGSAVAP